METKEISKETLEKVRTLPRIDFNAFTELVNQKQVNRLVKFKKPKTIFYDEDNKVFLYLNPFHKELNRCGYFIGDEMVTLKELSNSLCNAFFDWDINKHIKKLKSLLSVKHRADFSKEYFINFNFDLSSAELRDYYQDMYYFNYYHRFYDAVIKENTQEEIDQLINELIKYRDEK
jgi:hypothetical protein